jgi:hypothetical protein
MAVVRKLLNLLVLVVMLALVAAPAFAHSGGAQDPPTYSLLFPPSHELNSQ